MGLGVAHLATMITGTDLAVQLSGPEHHRCWATAPRVSILGNPVVRYISVFIRAALETTLMWLHTCALVVVATRNRPHLLHTSICMVCKLAGLIKRVRSLQHYPVLHGGLQAMQDYIPGQHIVESLSP